MSKYLASLSSSATASGTGGEGHSGFSKWQVLTLLGLGVSVAAVSIGAVYLWRRRTSKRHKLPDRSVEPQEDGTVESKSSTVETEPQLPGKSLDKALETKRQGNEYFKQKNFDEAIKCYEEAIEWCPVDKHEELAIFHHNIAASYENMISTAKEDEKTQLWKKIIQRCTQAITLNKRYLKAIGRRARAYDAMNMKRDSLLDVTRLLILDETQAQQFAQTTPQLLKDIGQQQAKINYPILGPLEPPTQLIKAYFGTFVWKDDISKKRLKSLWDTTHVKSSTDQSDSVINDDDVFNDEPFVKAASQFRDGQYTGVLNLLTEAVNTGNEIYKPHACLLRGTLYCLWRRDQDALLDLQLVIDYKNLPSEMYADAHIKCGAIYAGLCDLPKCYEQFEKASESKRDHPDIYIQRGRVCLESDDPSVIMKAIDDFEIALKLAPSSPHTLYCLGAVYHRGGLLSQSVHLLEGARSKFEEAYKQFPSCVEGIILYSLYLQDAQEVGKSEELLQKAVKLEPDNANAHFSLSLLYLLAHRDIDKAIKSLEAAIAMDSSCIQAYETLASLEMQKGNKNKAHSLYDLAVKNSRSIMELQQAYIAYEVFITQNQVCEEYGIDPLELMTSRLSGQGHSGMEVVL